MDCRRDGWWIGAQVVVGRVDGEAHGKAKNEELGPASEWG